jgi:hypothetical protein
MDCLNQVIISRFFLKNTEDYSLWGISARNQASCQPDFSLTLSRFAEDLQLQWDSSLRNYPHLGHLFGCLFCNRAELQEDLAA